MIAKIAVKIIMQIYLNFLKKANQLSFHQLRDSTMDFYIEAITHEIPYNDKRYKYTCRSNPSHEEQVSLSSLQQDNSIVIKSRQTFNCGNYQPQIFYCRSRETT